MVHVYGMEASASVLLGTARLPPVPGGTGGGEEQLRGTLREMVLEDPGGPLDRALARSEEGAAPNFRQSEPSP